MFNFGGGPGIRVHQFGGARPRGRPRDTQNGNNEEEGQGGGIQNLVGMLPILLFFIIPLLTSLFGGDGGPATPNMRFDEPAKPYTYQRTTPEHGIKYFVRKSDISKYTISQLNALDRTAEREALQHIANLCRREQTIQQQHMEDAQGWFYTDEEKMKMAKDMVLTNCNRWSGLMDKSKKGK